MSNKLDNDSQIGRLIHLVKPHPILYDESAEGFNDKEKKDLLWTEIGKKLGTSSRISRRKWVGLMLKFRQRQDEGEAAVTDKDGKVWPWYGKMQFVKRRYDDIKSVVEDIPASDTADEDIPKKIELPNVTKTVNGVQSRTLTNENANKLFLESLVEDLSSLNVADQYEFKKKVMDLMHFYVARN